jgi:hypothetical protein
MTIQSTLLRPSELTLTEKSLFGYALMHQNDTDFDIPFDKAIEFLGLQSEKAALRTLKANYSVDEDYKSIRMPSQGGRPQEAYMLTSDCFCSFCISSHAPGGKLIRSFYRKALRHRPNQTKLDHFTKESVLGLTVLLDLGMITIPQYCSEVENKLMDSFTDAQRLEAQKRIPEFIREIKQEMANQRVKEASAAEKRRDGVKT